MSNTKRVLLAALMLSLNPLGGCGLFVPEKNVFYNDAHKPGDVSSQAVFENLVAAHIACEITRGLMEAKQIQTSNNGLAWIDGLVASVQLAITVDENTTLNPSVTAQIPLSLAAITASLTGSAKATRVETISFTVSAASLLSRPRENCNYYQGGILIESDLKINQFIYDKAYMATTGELTDKTPSANPYSTFTDKITFVASYGGSATPTWKFAKVLIDPAGNLISATRNRTHDVLITLSQGTKETPTSPAKLSPEGQVVHSANVYGSATAAAIQGQSRPASAISVLGN
jgi:hypothetical protein